MSNLNNTHMETLPFDQYDDDFILDFDNYEDITYSDNYGDYVDVYLKGEFIAEVLVYFDDENDNREYICINNEVIYLDTLTKIN